jgi:hypothetical protein
VERLSNLFNKGHSSYLFDRYLAVLDNHLVFSPHNER